MPSPVLEVMKTLLVTVYADTFSDPIDRCLGTNIGDGKHCRKSPSTPTGRDIATQRMRSFMVLGEVPHDERFYKEIEEFLRYSHCHTHRKTVLNNFQIWKQERGQSPVDRATSAPTSPAVDENLDIHQSRASPPVSNPVAQTPKKMDKDTTDTDEQDTNSDVLGSTTVSPSQESDIAFTMASPASTAITTPGPTPSDADPSSRPLDAFDDTKSRPETPTPAPRKPSVPATDPKTANEELADILAQYTDQGPEALGRIERFKSVKRKKWPLLKAIEDKFTATDYKKGRVYVWTHQKNERLVKIGFTGEDSDARRRQAGNCYAKNTEPQWQSPKSFIGAHRVESIVHKHLSESNIELTSCALCRKGHKEWFEMDWRQAVNFIEEWTQFVTVAYADGRLSEQGVQMMNELCSFPPEKLVAALSAKTGPVQAEELTIMSEESKAGQQTIILEEQISVLAGDEEMSVTVNAAPGPHSTDQVSSDITPDQNAALPSTGQVSVKEGWKSRARHVFKKAVLTMKTHGSHSGRSEFSEQANGERDGNEELFSKLFRRFYSTELKEAEDMPNQNQPDPADTRDDVQLKKKILAWMPKPRSRSTAA